MREDVGRREDKALTAKLRGASFIGCVSSRRSLIQWGVEMLLVSHYELAKELFFQIAISRFGGMECARLGDNANDNVKGIDVYSCVLQVSERGAITFMATTSTTELTYSTICIFAGSLLSTFV